MNVVDFRARQQENLAGQPVGPVLSGSAGTAVLAVRDFDLLDSRPDRRVIPVDPRPIEVRLDVGALQLVDIVGGPHSILRDVFPQQPDTIAGSVVDGGRPSLVDYQVINKGPVLLQLDDGAYRFIAEGNSSHKMTSLHKKSPWNVAVRMVFGGRLSGGFFLSSQIFLVPQLRLLGL